MPNKPPHRYSAAEAYLDLREDTSPPDTAPVPAPQATSTSTSSKAYAPLPDPPRGRVPPLKAGTTPARSPHADHQASSGDTDKPLPARPISLEAVTANNPPRRSQVPALDVKATKEAPRRGTDLNGSVGLVRDDETNDRDRPASTVFLNGAPTPHTSLIGDDIVRQGNGIAPPATAATLHHSGVLPLTDGEEEFSSRPQYVSPSSLSKARPGTKTPSALRESFQYTQDALMPPNGPQKIFHLMLSTRGRMQGSVLLRRPRDQGWTTSYCSIRSESGSLRSEVEGTKALLETLISDLRGYKAHCVYDKDSRSNAILLSSSEGAKELQIRPQNRLQLDAWFAAFLCWQPVRKGQRYETVIRQKSPRPLAIVPQEAEHDLAENHDQNEVGRPSVDEDDRIVEAGKSMLIHWRDDVFDRQKPKSPRQSSTQAQASFVSEQIATKVSCVLCSGGELSVQHPGSDGLSIIATINLKKFPRSAIQRVYKSVLGVDNVIAIYPQYALSAEASSCIRPVYLSFGSKISFEIWFTLLRSFAVAEMYRAEETPAESKPKGNEDGHGNDEDSASALFRIEHSITVRVIKASFNVHHGSPHGAKSGDNDAKLQEPALDRYFAEVLFDGQVNARSSVTPNVKDPSWFESYGFEDISSVLSVISVRVRRHGERSRSSHSDKSSSDGHSSKSRASLAYTHQNRLKLFPDKNTCGEACIDMSELDKVSDIEKLWPMADPTGAFVGELSIKVAKSDEVVLIEEEYTEILAALHHLPNILTLKICQRIPSNLMALAGCFLNIFQASGIAVPWLLSLAEEEIYNVSRRLPTGRRGSEPSRQPVTALDSDGREEGERDRPEASVISQVSLLFRANTLFTKALDFYMKRMGQAYLEATIGRKMRQIVSDNIDCEVDPNRVPDQNEASLRDHWQHLIEYTKDLWALIYNSAALCPAELKVIFRHIRICAEGRFGHVMPSVKYSSVSGFLFLRFYCAAITNPQLFSLVDGAPGQHANRTFVLMAKSLQGLANMTVFGNKEPWMSPMNSFCSSHRTQLKELIDSICASSEPSEDIDIPSSLYNTPQAVIKQLPTPAREGCLSLPHLIDRPRNLATLTTLWLDNADATIGRRSRKITIEGNEVAQKRSFDTVASEVFEELVGKDVELEKFHSVCRALRERSRTCLEQAETTTERRGGAIEHQWVALAEAIEARPDDFWVREMPESPAHSVDGFSPTTRGRNGEGERPTSRETHPESSSIGSGGSGKKQRKKKPSPPRNAEANAMRKLGWM